MAAEGVTPSRQAVAWAMTRRPGSAAPRSTPGGRPGRPTPSTSACTAGGAGRVGGYDGATSAPRTGDEHRIRQAGGLVWFEPALRVTYGRAAACAPWPCSTSTTAAGRRGSAGTPGTVNSGTWPRPPRCWPWRAGWRRGRPPGARSRARGRHGSGGPGLAWLMMGSWCRRLPGRAPGVTGWPPGNCPAARSRRSRCPGHHARLLGVGFLTSPRRLLRAARGPAGVTSEGPGIRGDPPPSPPVVTGYRPFGVRDRGQFIGACWPYGGTLDMKSSTYRVPVTWSRTGRTVCRCH